MCHSEMVLLFQIRVFLLFAIRGFLLFPQPSHRDDKIRKKVGWRKDPYHSVGV